ncbi:hypothetical protein GCM10022207_71330 [Streptomyces lannensis]|uniref:Uncharacterized protein n=1 Tax=Streptomyces lannensis TaxID=766498 RepID=A0ABP7L1G5_9ACTN
MPTSRVGGSTLTLHTAEQVIPQGFWSRPMAVTTPTPLGKLDMRERKSAGELR